MVPACEQLSVLRWGVTRTHIVTLPASAVRATYLCAVRVRSLGLGLSPHIPSIVVLGPL